MSASAHDYFADLETPLPAAKPAKVEAKRFPCQSCAGTGKYPGIRTQQEKSHCFACKGAGSFATSYGDRMKAKAASAARATRALETAQRLTREENPGLVEFLQANTWSQFLKDMLDLYNRKGELSDKMVAAVRRTQAKVEARDAERKAAKATEQAQRTVALDLSAIHGMFDKAQEAGLKKLVYRAEGLVLSLAKPDSSNPGAIYVKTKGGDYLGKVLNKAFQANREATDDHRQALNVIAANPSKAAKDYGMKTGECSCCGRELTDPVSIANGIGPICADKWGF